MPIVYIGILGDPGIGCKLLKIMVGERGFEPPTPWSRTRCSTRLSHSPTNLSSGMMRMRWENFAGGYLQTKLYHPSQPSMPATTGNRTALTDRWTYPFLRVIPRMFLLIIKCFPKALVTLPNHEAEPGSRKMWRYIWRGDSANITIQYS